MIRIPPPFGMALALAAIASLPASAQTTPVSTPEPTLQETMEFLTGFMATSLQTNTNHDWSQWNRQFPLVQSENCTLSVHTRQVGRDYRYTVDLSLIDPLTITNGEVGEPVTEGEGTYATVTIESTGRRPLINQNHISWQGDRPVIRASLNPVVTLWFYGQPDMMERFRRGLDHAVKLCGGQVSPF